MQLKDEGAELENRNYNVVYATNNECAVHFNNAATYQYDVPPIVNLTTFFWL